tara:strand:+ start:175 stop:417 length:243 start_codon:yes stop_codon:yes gene_type:complete
MRDEKFLVRSLFFSSRTSENARTSDLENERQNLFFNSKQKAKILPRLLLLFKEEQVSLDQKFKKTAEFFLQQTERKQRKK